jgi:hypothetical protein
LLKPPLSQDSDILFSANGGSNNNRRPNSAGAMNFIRPVPKIANSAAPPAGPDPNLPFQRRRAPVVMGIAGD